MEGIINEGMNVDQREETQTPTLIREEVTEVINVDEGGPFAEAEKDKKEEELDVLRRTFLDNMTLDLEPDFELNAEVIRAGVLVSFFEGNGVSRTRLKEILEQIWKLKDHWRFKTLKLGVWGIFFDKEEDCVTVLDHRPWLINGKLLIVHEWPEHGSWNMVDLTKAVFWVEATGLPTPYLNRINTPTIAAKAGDYKGCDTVDQKVIVRRGFLKSRWKSLRNTSFHRDSFLTFTEKFCIRSTPYAYPPEGDAIPAFGPWIKAESAVISCFNTRNQLAFFRDNTRGNTTPTAHAPSKGTTLHDKGKG
uniref:DUF4283 domain-containing protein n=1 Tax=Cannabis sativa TaxID=3483 RepID=A0A803Q5I6_CANSA